MNTLYKIGEGGAEAMEFTVNQTTRHLGTPLKDLPLKKGILVAVIIHQGRTIIPEGSSAMELGDARHFGVQRPRHSGHQRHL